MIMNNFRMTPQRRIILEELKKTRKHPTADEVYHSVRKKLPDISMGTVYRNLEILTKQEEVQVIRNGGKKKRYDGNSTKHFHIKCTNCGRIDDLPENLVGLIKKNITVDCGYEITGYSLVLYGLCPDCKKKLGGK